MRLYTPSCIALSLALLLSACATAPVQKISPHATRVQVLAPEPVIDPASDKAKKPETDGAGTAMSDPHQKDEAK